MNREILFIFGCDDGDVSPEEHVLPLFRKLRSLNAENIRIESFIGKNGQIDPFPPISIDYPNAGLN